MTADASQVRIRPGTLDDNHACAAVLVDGSLFCAPALIL
jgi:hypothetical protein